MTRDLERLALLSGLIRQVRTGQAGAARLRAAALRADLSAPALTVPPDGADADRAAQHARWAAARRRALVRDLALAERDATASATAARRAIGTDQAIARLAAGLEEERRRRVRRA